MHQTVRAALYDAHVAISYCLDFRSRLMLFPRISLSTTRPTDGILSFIILRDWFDNFNVSNSKVRVTRENVQDFLQEII